MDPLFLQSRNHCWDQFIDMGKQTSLWIQSMDHFIEPAYGPLLWTQVKNKDYGQGPRPLHGSRYSMDLYYRRTTWTLQNPYTKHLSYRITTKIKIIFIDTSHLFWHLTDAILKWFHHFFEKENEFRFNELWWVIWASWQSFKFLLGTLDLPQTPQNILV